MSYIHIKKNSVALNSHPLPIFSVNANSVMTPTIIIIITTTTVSMIFNP